MLRLLALAWIWGLAHNCTPLAAQSTVARAVLARYRASLDSGGAPPTMAAPHLDSLGPDLGRLSASFEQYYRGRDKHNSDDLDEARTGFSRLVNSHPAWPEGWFGLGLTRLALYAQGRLAQEGPAQPVGMSYAGGAEQALIRALEIDPHFLEAARALADAPAIVPPEHMHSAGLGALRRATDTSPTDPIVLLGRARWESAGAHTDSAVAVLHRYLTAGGDSAIGAFHLARQLFRSGASADAVAWYFLGAAKLRSDIARVLYRQDLAWIASPDELREFDSTSPGNAAAWVRRFWDSRDAHDARSPGERLAEHYRRYEYALKHFRIDLRRNYRGPPNPLPSITRGTAETQAVPDVTTGDDSRPLDEPPWSGAWAMLASSPTSREYKPFQTILDDRGVIYIRHGPPDATASYLGPPGTPANISWKYIRESGDLLFHFIETDFDGSVGPSMLIPALPPGREMLEARCGIDSRLCLLSMRSQIPPEQLVHQRDRGRQDIRQGTTTDDYPRRFRRALKAVLQAHSVFMVGGTAGLLIVFGAPGDRLVPVEAELGSGLTAYRVRLQVAAYNVTTGTRIDLDTVRTFRAQSLLRQGQYLGGFDVLPAPPGRYQVTVLLAQDGDARGTGTLFDSLTVEAPIGAGLAMSSVILGRPRAGLSWKQGTVEVPLNPTNSFTRGQPASLYFAVRGMVPDTDYSVELSVARADAPGKILLRLQSVDRSAGLTGSFQRTLDLHKLKPEHYILRIRLQSERTKETVERRVTLNLAE